MKPLEILSALPKWANAAPESLLDSPAWAMPCRLGDASATLRAAEVRPGESLDLAVLLDGERHLLSIADSPRFADLHALWATRAEVPEPILLALVEKECGVLLQLVENAVRRQLKVEGLASEGPDERTFFMQVEDVVFGLTRSPVVEAALGQLRFVDTTHQSVREEPLPCETEVASFVLSAADIASIAVGDALLLPEVGTVPPRLVVDGRFLVDENGVAPFSDDGRLRVVDAAPRTISLGELFDRAESPVEEADAKPSQLRLVSSGKTLAEGSLDKLAGQSAFVVEAVGPLP